MTDKSKIELGVGMFMAAGIAALFMLSMKVSNLSGFSGEGYDVKVNFENIGGLKVRAPVMMAGVRIGEVSRISLNTETFEASVVITLGEQYNQLPKDTSANIYTSGLLGEQYISLEAGGEEDVLKAGDEIKLSQSAMVLEQVLGQFIFSKAAGDE
ncbi:MAG TPA: outer membrane lipid asymmetry maintenance protein MlaD [Gammaproteobacteria bacterium]|nr:outer membrane lipid asymmetry maintenance protein MlaD [Gammaproteobacteria bacterium]